MIGAMPAALEDEFSCTSEPWMTLGGKGSPLRWRRLSGDLLRLLAAPAASPLID